MAKKKNPRSFKGYLLLVFLIGIFLIFRFNSMLTNIIKWEYALIYDHREPELTYKKLMYFSFRKMTSSWMRLLFNKIKNCFQSTIKTCDDAYCFNLRSGSISFRFVNIKHSGGQGETKRERPILAWRHKRECMRTTKIGPDLLIKHISHA